MNIKACRKLSPSLINQSQMKSVKTSMRGIENYYKNKGKNIDTDAIWDKTSKAWEKDMGSTFRQLTVVGYDARKMRIMCRGFMQIITVWRPPGSKKPKKKKDF